MPDEEPGKRDERPDEAAAAPGRELSPAARRALQEAAERRARAEAASRPKEVNGPRGPEPTRYGDWERRGKVVDF